MIAVGFGGGRGRDRRRWPSSTHPSWPVSRETSRLHLRRHFSNPQTSPGSSEPCPQQRVDGVLAVPTRTHGGMGPPGRAARPGLAGLGGSLSAHTLQNCLRLPCCI